MDRVCGGGKQIKRSAFLYPEAVGAGPFGTGGHGGRVAIPCWRGEAHTAAATADGPFRHDFAGYPPSSGGALPGTTTLLYPLQPERVEPQTLELRRLRKACQSIGYV